MLFLRDLAYGALIWAGLPYVIYRQIVRGKDLAGLDAKLGKIAPREGGAPCVWIHGVSVGEVMAAGALVERLKLERPEWDIIVSSSTGTGFEVATKKFGADKVFYYPFDFSWVCRKALDSKRPNILVLMEFEVWPNMVELAKQREIPVVVVNGRITEKAYKRMKKFLPFYGESLKNVSRYCVQNEAYADRLRNLNVPNSAIDITGSMKFDAVLASASKIDRQVARKVFHLEESQCLLVAGSTHNGEERALVAAFQSLQEDFPGLRLLLAPRHPERWSEVAKLLDATGIKWIHKSQISDSDSKAKIILLDTMGELLTAYAAADVVYVGGSLIPHGGQNPLEPAAVGQIPIFGPNMWNFSDIVDYLQSHKACRMIQNRQELCGALRDAISKPNGDDERRKISQSIVEGAGATEKNLNVILNLVDNILNI